MSEVYDYVVIGAGIVGLATAYELRNRFPKAKILVLEKEKAPGLHASGRNSGVLHSGIYYSPNSVKAKVCREGGRRMVLFAKEHGIALRPGGKLIVATDESERPRLQSLMENARANQIHAELISESEIKKLVPHCKACEAIYLPDVAVIDTSGVVQKLAQLLKDSGADLRFEEGVEVIHPQGDELKTKNGTYSYGHLFNCAGAYADVLARYFGLASGLALIPFKGTYYELRHGRESLVNSNIYPVPDPTVPFLGVHFTRSVEGHVHVGPTAMPAFGRENYGVLKGIDLNEMPEIVKTLSGMFFSSNEKFRKLAFQEWANYFKPRFVAQAQKLIPEIQPDDLVPSAKVGIRPQLVNLKTKELVMDYVVEQTPNSTHVLNAISPAFTSAFSFAEWLLNGKSN